MDTKKQSAPAEGLKEGIGCMPMDGNVSVKTINGIVQTKEEVKTDPAATRIK